jgi:hypothetical protein
MPTKTVSESIADAYEAGKRDGYRKGMRAASNKCLQFGRETMIEEARLAYVNASQALDKLAERTPEF